MKLILAMYQSLLQFQPIKFIIFTLPLIHVVNPQILKFCIRIALHFSWNDFNIREKLKTKGSCDNVTSTQGRFCVQRF